MAMLTSLIFLFVKVMSTWHSDYDTAIFLVLFILDWIAIGEWYRIYLHKKERG